MININLNQVNMSRAECRTEEAKRFIETHIKIPGPPEIAEQLGIPYETLRKDFRRVEGVTLGAFITRKKVEYMKHLLEKTDLRCFEISDRVGFSREEVCMRVFKKHTGMTMLAYRRQHSCWREDEIPQ